MRHSLTLTPLVIMCLLTGTSIALGLGGDHPPGKLDPAVANKEWPKGLVALINRDGRVQGHWVNQNDFFYYKGDVSDFNKFVAQYAELPDTPLKVVIHAGSNQLAGPLGKERTIPYQWQLEIMRRGWGVALLPNRPANDPGYVVTVHVWLGETIALDKLDLPKAVQAESAKDIENFIEQHKKSTR